MDLSFSAEEQKFRQDLRAFFAEERVQGVLRGLEGCKPRVEAHSQKIYQWLGERGWLAPNWPVEYGGAGKTAVEAAILSEEIAQVAQFYSFGTNDLTQMTMGLSRDDAGRFLPDYVNANQAAIFKEDPFQSLDQAGVGRLVSWAIDQGRAVNPQLKIGICGEHGGDPESVKFCHRVGMNYVSCSPYRVPIARLAAAQAVIEEEQPPRRAKAAKRCARRKTAKKR